MWASGREVYERSWRQSIRWWADARGVSARQQIVTIM